MDRLSSFISGVAVLPIFPQRLAPQPRFAHSERDMAILSDKWIRKSARETGMIEPFVEAQRRDGGISYGLSS